MKPKDFADQLAGLAVLDEPARRKLYLYVSEQAGEVGRDEAAEATGLSRHLAAFHLDRLVEAGLLESTFRRLSGRAGPGAGRPAKLYRRATTQFDVSLPPRRYELAAHVLAQAWSEVGDMEPLMRAARDWGKRLAADADGGGRRSPIARATQALQACGFEPRTDPSGAVVLHNCPFASLGAARREVICGMNLALVEGLLEGLEVQGVEARLTPSPGKCCVSLVGAVEK